MSNNESIEIVIGLIEGEDGQERYIAASKSSPYFCFEAPTEAEVEGLVDRALAFYHIARNQKPTKSRVETRHYTRLVPIKVLHADRSARTLEAA